MRTIAVIGGKLQGLEAVYLAEKAGMQSILIDRKANVPAAALCDRFYRLDVMEESRELIRVLGAVDCILPAMENEAALTALVQMSRRYGWTLLFDPEAYAISASKLKSDRLFRAHDIPAPAYYPDCGVPCIVKPSGESGSAGVRRFDSEKDLQRFLGTNADGEWVVQEFLAGRSYSIEIIGTPGHYRAYTITEIHMDDVYDCKMVSAPCPELTARHRRKFAEIGISLAEQLTLRGIMDVEAILYQNQLKVLEIDARFPSQTPIAVWHSSGMNLLQELVDIGLTGAFQTPQRVAQRCCTLEQLLIGPDGISAHGEHIIAAAKNLRHLYDSFGADEVLCDLNSRQDRWCGTFINTAETWEALEQKRAGLLQKAAAYLPVGA